MKPLQRIHKSLAVAVCALLCSCLLLSSCLLLEASPIHSSRHDHSPKSQPSSYVENQEASDGYLSYCHAAGCSCQFFVRNHATACVHNAYVAIQSNVTIIKGSDKHFPAIAKEGDNNWRKRRGNGENCLTLQ